MPRVVWDTHMGLADTTKDLEETCALLLQWLHLVVKQSILRHWEWYVMSLLRKLNPAPVLLLQPMESPQHLQTAPSLPHLYCFRREHLSPGWIYVTTTSRDVYRVKQWHTFSLRGSGLRLSRYIGISAPLRLHPSNMIRDLWPETGPVLLHKATNHLPPLLLLLTHFDLNWCWCQGSLTKSGFFRFPNDLSSLTGPVHPGIPHSPAGTDSSPLSVSEPQGFNSHVHQRWVAVSIQRRMIEWKKYFTFTHAS